MAISISSRDDSNNAAMVAPDVTNTAGFNLRPISLGSLELLRQINNPLATGSDNADLDFHVIAEFVWIHAAPIEAVVETVYNRPSQIAREVALFCMNISPSDIKLIGASLAGDRAAIQAASAAPVPEENDSPNAPTHP